MFTAERTDSDFELRLECAGGVGVGGRLPTLDTWTRDDHHVGCCSRSYS